MEKILDKVQAISDRLTELETMLDQPDISDGDIYMILSEAKSLDVQLSFLKEAYTSMQSGTVQRDPYTDNQV